MKKILSLLLSVILLLSVFAPCACAANSMTLTLSSIDYSPSDTNRLYIYVGVSGSSISCDVTIYNSNGAPVAMLSRDGMSTNVYTFIWDARAAENNPAGLAAGEFVPSGAYTVKADCSGAGSATAQVYIENPVTATKYGDDEHGIPNYTGDADVDYMAECILNEIGVNGKSNYDIVRDVYTWVQANGYRANSTYVIHDDDSLNTLYFDLDAMAGEIAEAEEYYDHLHDAGLISYNVDKNLYIKNARQMMVYRIGTCREFSALVQILLNHVGIECWLASGYFHNSDGSTMVHEWNLIRINGIYYWADVRIDNAEYERSGRTKLHYDYFLDLNTAAWAKRHTWDHNEYPYRDTLTPAMEADGIFTGYTAPIVQPPVVSDPVTPGIVTVTPQKPAFEGLSVSDGRNKKAVVSTAKVVIDGVNYDFEAYNIDDCNYFRLRDIAFALNGSGSQFSVNWNGELNCINLVAGVPYTIADGELSRSGKGSTTAIPTPSRIICSGYDISLAGYLIYDNNYFRLRDLGILFNFDIGWDGVNGIITITTA